MPRNLKIWTPFVLSILLSYSTYKWGYDLSSWYVWLLVLAAHQGLSAQSDMCYTPALLSVAVTIEEWCYASDAMVFARC
jgi:hypothetical protein